MLYTLGHKKNYDEGLLKAQQTGEPLRKMGRQADYPGGVVFLSVEEAEKHIRDFGYQDTYAVYGLKTSIENTYTIGSKRFLIGHAEISAI